MALLKLIVAALAATSVVSASHIHVARDEPSSINPVDITTIPLGVTLSTRGLTNAKRLALGLPLNKPHRRDGSLRARTSPTPTAPAVVPTPQPEPGCVNRSGVIRVHSEDTEEYDGYLESHGNQFGELGYTTDINDALKVTLKSCDGSPFAIVTSNSPAPDLPFLGGIVGFANTNDNLSSGSYHYAYVGVTTETPRNSPPTDADNSFSRTTSITRKAESTIWTVDEDNIVKAHWVNTDSSKPETFIIYAPQDKTFIITGDRDKLRKTFGDWPESTFTFEEL